MSFILSLSQQEAAFHWGEKAKLSFSENGATIHVSAQDDLRSIRQAARTVDGLNILHVTFEGEWQVEQQWAFASSFSAAKKHQIVDWCDNEDAAVLQQRFEALILCRELVNGTPEDISPLVLAEKAAHWLSDQGGTDVSVHKVIGEELLEQGWNGIYEVGRGSERPPVLLEVDFNPTGNPDAQVEAALVGKGITFDSGGYSIKSSEGMLDMKCDMAGAATVTAALGLAINEGLNKRVKLFLCCAENLISGHAYKLGDVIHYKNGVNVEVVNTDAEGRLVLADGLMAASECHPNYIIDAATLTGAAMVAVGNDYNALFALDTQARDFVQSSAAQVNEGAWPLPLEKFHQNKCPSHFADTANSRAQKGGGMGGASNAAGFLSRFVDSEAKGWVHMDLAAAYNGSGTPEQPPGASGVGMRTIAQALLNM